MNKLLELCNINKSFHSKKQILIDVNLTIMEGSVCCLVGESGCGKSTLCGVITGLVPPDSGWILLKEHRVGSLRKRTLDDCFDFQYVFQDPYTSINSAWTVKTVLEEPQRLCSRNNRCTRSIEEALELVGLTPSKYLNNLICELSGGQRQRLAIARALIPNPRIIIADECTSMLDDAAAQDICMLFTSLRNNHNISFLVVTHNAGVLQYFPDDVAMMHEGRIVERGSLLQIINNPLHPYTKLWSKSMTNIEGALFHE